MSFNHLMYDTCAYQKALKQSTGVGAYQLYPGKYNNCRKCRMELGLVGGNAVSLYKGNLVDLESDLRGQTRAASMCPSHKFQPRCKQPCCSGLPSGPVDCNAELIHQPACQMIRYPPTVLPPSQKVAFCPGLYQTTDRGDVGCPQKEQFCNKCGGYEYETLPKWVPPPQAPCPMPKPAPIPEMCGQKPQCPRCMQPGNMCNCTYY
jgi:hypothetical protein